LKKKIMIHGFKTMQEMGVSEKAIFWKWWFYPIFSDNAKCTVVGLHTHSGEWS
jgi:hypothetical protein